MSELPMEGKKAWESWAVARVEGVWGGRYLMVPRSRIPVFMIADLYQEGGDALVRENYDHLSEAQLGPVYRFLKEHPEAVEADRALYREDTRRTQAEFRRWGRPLRDEHGEVIGYSMNREDLARMQREREGEGED